MGVSQSPSPTSLTDYLSVSFARAEPSDGRRRQLRCPGRGLFWCAKWQGTTHQVTVVNDGFLWKGQTYRSLSSIAHAITGTKWNGPRFFGMREENGRKSVTSHAR